MSAFICNPDHIIELALYASSGRCYGGPRVTPDWVRSIAGRDVAGLVSEKALTDPCRYPELLANILYLANVRSVRYRYPSGPLPGPVDLPECITIDSHSPQVTDPVHILKMSQCLDYQSCEAPDWEGSTAWHILQAIQKRAIQELPGYSDAPWEYDRQEAVERARRAREEHNRRVSGLLRSIGTGARQ